MLYNIPKLHREYKNIAKTLNKTDEMLKEFKNNITQPNEDWFAYFLDKISHISDESVQTVFSYILKQECVGKGSFKKVYLDKLALLDQNTAKAFLKLCALTYEVITSDGRSYSIPFFLYDSTLSNMVDCKKVRFTEDDAALYQKTLPDIEELELLQEIGLIQLSEENDQCDIYSKNKIAFTFNVANESFFEESLFDKQNLIYYLFTGNAIYTQIGLALYNSISKNSSVYRGLIDLLKGYLVYVKDNQNKWYY